jgi:Flp pilus assembly protein TadB
VDGNRSAATAVVARHEAFITVGLFQKSTDKDDDKGEDEDDSRISKPIQMAVLVVVVAVVNLLLLLLLLFVLELLVAYITFSLIWVFHIEREERDKVPQTH